MALRPLPRPSGETVRRFLFEITTITLGILIALWIDEVREGRRDAALVRNARAQLAREVADNQMDCPDLKTYTELYDLQDLVDRAQERYRQLLTEQSAEFFLATQRPLRTGSTPVASACRSPDRKGWRCLAPLKPIAR